MHVKKWTCANVHICVHLTHMFSFVIYSHDCAFYGIVLHNKKTKRKAIPTNTAKRISPQTKKELIGFSFAMFFDHALQSNHWMSEKKVRIHISGSTRISHKQVLRTGKHVVVGVLICNEIYFDVPDIRHEQCFQWVNWWICYMKFEKRQSMSLILWDVHCTCKKVLKIVNVSAT